MTCSRLCRFRGFVAFCFIAAAFLPALTPLRAQSSPPPQLRGFWVDGFHDGFKTAFQVDTLVRDLQRTHCNAVWAQVRKRGDAYYASRYEPRAADNRTPGFDPLAYLIARCHASRPRIAVHAWVNCCAVGQASDPAHILSRHPDWRSVSFTGLDDREGAKIDPGVPGAAEWTYRVYLDVVRQYDVDGIHFDFVRYAGPDWGYAPASVARYNARYGTTGLPRPDDAQWQQWRRDQVTNLVRRVYVSVAALRPDVTVSAATICWGDAPRTLADWPQSAAYHDVAQNWQGWLAEGILDLACPMTYFARSRHADYQEHWAEFIKSNQQNRAATLAVGAWLNSPADSLALARVNLQPGADGKTVAGVLFYSYAGSAAGEAPGALLDVLPTLFPTDASLPTFPWKAHPTQGHVKGIVLAGNSLAPADSANVILSPRTGTAASRGQVTDGSGFFAFVDVAPGDYTLTVTDGGETTLPQAVTVEAGSVTTHDFLLASGDLPAPRAVSGVGAEKSGTPLLFKSRTVTVGTDAGGDHFYLADDAGVAGVPIVRVRVNGSLSLPIVAGDRVTLIGTVQHEANGAVYVVADAKAVQVVGAAR